MNKGQKTKGEHIAAVAAAVGALVMMTGALAALVFVIVAGRDGFAIFFGAIFVGFAVMSGIIARAAIRWAKEAR